ncbi:M16C subfamily peptidase [Treponema paraluiscuniculi Cuniculi A]|uniref:M16C subfamily peptidase n=2 Tax=Treponema paraluiscuniculi TaxID=53435 RepID=F7XRL7_TREPU|nr:insulinase family protein [Treponema paraluiscuniculi]AEH39979.1 M16C subfamily peptidase [Treponema paraluiscuniculi Cuniculi A]WKC71912.1 M16C subfamily peptidase [Treponema paraluiscuniculi]
MSTLLHGFEIIWRHSLAELSAVGVYARHKKTGLELYHILNEDPENLFAFCFMTAEEASTGVAHILEHSVLCGSQHYPLKDPFLILAKQSVKTFLNALTFPDKTVYPASSLVETDYFDVMSVYADAVFFPLIEEWTFKQEGHRFEFNEHNQLTLQGVVLNEMRGVYADFHTLVYKHATHATTRGSVYAHDSGGHPTVIPRLTYESFKAFHKKHYHPSNCKLFLYGNIPTEKQMAFIEDKCLSKFSARKALPPIPPIPAYQSPRTYTGYAPASEGMDLTRCAVLLSWLLPESDKAEQLMDVFLLEHVLLGHDAAPLAQALLESELGEDLYAYNGSHIDLKRMLFFVGMTGVQHTQVDALKACVFETLESLVAHGIPPQEVETALNALEFSNTEVRRSDGPFSLVLMQRSLRGWLHGAGPESSLRYIPALQALREKVHHHPHYVENLILTHLLRNPQYTVLSVHPDPDFSKKLDEQLEKYVQDFSRTLTQPAAARLRADQESLRVRQTTPDPEELLALLPHIKREQLPVPTPELSETMQFFGSVPVLVHELATNDITYLHLAIPADMLSVKEAQLLPLYAYALTGMGTETHHWSVVSAEIARLTGGFAARCIVAGDQGSEILPLLRGQNTLQRSDIVGRAWLVVSVKMLSRFIVQAISYVCAHVRSLSFTDTRRLKDILAQYKNDLDSAAMHSGHSIALAKANARVNAAKAVEELWTGVTQIRLVRALWTECTETVASPSLAAKLKALHEKLLTAGVIGCVCGTETSLHTALDALAKPLACFRAPLSTYFIHHTSAPTAHEQQIPSAHGVLFQEALQHMRTRNMLTLLPAPVQVGFAALSLAHPRLPLERRGVEQVFARYLSTEPFWEKIRTIGGAYGAFTLPDPVHGIFSSLTYRDPNPLHSLDVIFKTIEHLHADHKGTSSLFNQKTMERLIIGAYSTAVTPETPEHKSFASFLRFLNGTTETERIAAIEHILDARVTDMHLCTQLLWAQRTCAEAAVVSTATSVREAATLEPYFSKLEAEPPL